MGLFARFIRNEHGATAIEYGLIAALIGLAIMVGINSLSSSMVTMFGKIENNVK